MELTPPQKQRLKDLEARLQRHVREGAIEKAIEVTADIQGFFGSDLSHHRLLRAKLWCFEAALLANRSDYAATGIEAVRRRAGVGTKLRLEATVLLVICRLRQKRLTDAKRLIRQIVENLNNIQSARSRRLFQKKFLERLEEEAVLSELIGLHEGELNVEAIQTKAVYLLQNNSGDEIYTLIGNSLPSHAVLVLQDVRSYAVAQIRSDDVKLLPPSQDTQRPPKLGKQAFAVFKRIAWKTFCSPDSQLYKLWSKRLPAVYNDKMLAAALVTTLTEWRIGLPLLASGILAAVFKYSAAQFCEWAKPDVFMTTRREIRESDKL
jgi:hypothetical protein